MELGMKKRQSIPITIGVAVIVVAAVLIGVAMFVVDQGEETGHLFNELRSKASGDRGSNNIFRGNDVELRGHWLGMDVANVDSASAARLGLGDIDSGAVIVDVDPRDGSRALSAGLQSGDIIAGVEHKPVRDIGDLYAMRGKIPPDSPIMIDVLRHNQLVTLVVPPLQRDFGVQAAMGGPQLYCPRDGVLVPAGSVQGAATCPRCNGPLHMYHSGVGGGRGPGNGGGMRGGVR
jgi:hypothetical protein